jgi:hypothetical protein
MLCLIWCMYITCLNVMIHKMPLAKHELIALPKCLSSPPGFSGVRVTWSLVLCVMICRSLFVLLSLFFWPLCCLSFNLRILITPLVSSTSSYYTWSSNHHIISFSWQIYAQFMCKLLLSPFLPFVVMYFYLQNINEIPGSFLISKFSWKFCFQKYSMRV